MTPIERDDYLNGQVAALLAMAQAMLRTHPDPDLVLQVFEQQLLNVESAMLARPVRDAWLEGIRNIQGNLYRPGTNPAEER